METFTVRNLEFTYPGQSEPAIKNINFNIHVGEFVCLCGKSGCGKSTLLRNLKTILAPHGRLKGQVLFYGKPLDEISDREQATRIGYVLQNPDSQLVTDKVWHELAFGLENLGYDDKTIRLRVSEMASFFGIQTWFEKKVTELSGGQKQLLNLAAVMVMQPDVLILDEPTSQLDPIAATDFLETVKKINREIGTTVIVTEHRLDDVLPMSDRTIIMDEGRIIIDDTPIAAGKKLAAARHDMFMGMPTPFQAYSMLYNAGIGRDLDSPMDVQQGREYLTELCNGKDLKVTSIDAEDEPSHFGEAPKIELRDVWFRYSKNDKDVVKDLSLKIYEGELFAIVGGNGTGKTTTLTLISGINKAYRGKVKLDGREIGKYKDHELFQGLLGVLPQNPQAIFVEKTVRLDLMEMFEGRKVPKEERKRRVEEVAEMVDITKLLDRHPYDLSGGEQQRAALAKILLLDPKIILLDEPTKGIDNYFKEKLATIFDELKARGITIVMVSHDIEFCGRHADRCAMFFDGNISTINAPRKFFSGNNFYTTAANRMSRHIFQNAVTAQDVAEIVKANIEPEDGFDPDDYVPIEPIEPDLPEEDENPEEGEPVEARIDDRAARKGRDEVVSFYREEHTAKKRIISIAAILVMVGTIFCFITLGGGKYYFAVSILMIFTMMIPFFASFERRKPHAREVIVIAVLITLGVLGRTIFFMLPQMKPVVAITVIAGACLGANSGFLVGSMIAFTSNFIFGQGPWTPFQMFALGIIGFIAGLLFCKRTELGTFKEPKKMPLMIYGFLSCYLYGAITDVWTMFVMAPHPTFGTVLLVYGSGFPFSTLLGVATVAFLAVLTKPMVEKLERVKLKFGLLESYA